MPQGISFTSEEKRPILTREKNERIRNLELENLRQIVAMPPAEFPEIFCYKL